ncbi:MAG: DUF1080 domain-containing protein, partial [Abitibacteriaceae bacterium]|nr:DUF1080 domain-containing protein [Abditibacteriaceae bacterium]
MRRPPIIKARFGVIAALLLAPFCAHSQESHIAVDAAQVVGHVSPWIYGSCTEDVNHEIYGGLYDQKVFGESFEEPPPSAKFQDWKTFGGSWSPSGAGVAVGAAEGVKLVSNTPAFSNGSVEADVRFPHANGENAGLLVRLSEPGVGADVFIGYEISLQPNSHLILGKHRHNWQPLVDVASPFTPEAWTHLRVVLSGPRIRVFVNGSTTPAIDYTDQDAPLLTGTFALRTWHSDAAFQNVRVQIGDAPASEKHFEAIVTPAVSGMWDAIQTGTAQAEFRLDTNSPYNGAQCQMVRHCAGAGWVGVANRGLNHWGIAVQQGQELAGRLYLRGAVQGRVTLVLQSADGSRTYAIQTLHGVTPDWEKFTIALKPNATDANARLAVMLDKPGTLWLDQVVLTPTGDARFNGLPVRADIARQLQNEGVTFLRYGGSMVNAPGYRWKNMIGDPDKRPPYHGTWYPYSTNGWGIEDFVQFCAAAKIEAAFAINIEETAQDAADLAEYLNGSVTTPWGRRRAQNGHPRPYGVRWIELGNEEVIGSDNAAEYDHYIQRFNALADAIYAKDPKIQLVCSAWWRPESANVERVFKALNGKAAYWDLHVWADDAHAGSDVERQLTQMQSLFQKWVPGTAMQCVIFEENGGLHNVQRALGHATILNAVRRHNDFVPVSCPANALQPWLQNDNGWDQGQIFFTPDRVWGMPPFYAQQMASRNHLPLRVVSQTAGNTGLDVTAARSEDGKTLVLHVVNTNALAQPATISLAGFEGCKPLAQAWTLTGELQATNPPDHPELIHSQLTTISTAGTQFNYTFPAHSY